MKSQHQQQLALNKGKAARIQAEMKFFDRALSGLRKPAPKKAK